MHVGHYFWFLKHYETGKYFWSEKKTSRVSLEITLSQLVRPIHMRLTNTMRKRCHETASFIRYLFSFETPNLAHDFI